MGLASKVRDFPDELAEQDTRNALHNLPGALTRATICFTGLIGAVDWALIVPV
jgi:hypothetical protein